MTSMGHCGGDLLNLNKPPRHSEVDLSSHTKITIQFMTVFTQYTLKRKYESLGLYILLYREPARVTGQSSIDATADTSLC